MQVCEHFSYSSPETPAGYRCGQCGATGVKLWREYEVSLESQELQCFECACKDQDRHPLPEENISSIGWLVGAVPTEDGETYWGYSSVPKEGCDWWYNLPTEKQAVTVPTGQRQISLE